MSDVIDFNQQEWDEYQDKDDSFYFDEDISGEDILGSGGCLYRKVCHNYNCFGRECKVYLAGNPEKTSVNKKDLINAIESAEISQKKLKKHYPFFNNLLNNKGNLSETFGIGYPVDKSKARYRTDMKTKDFPDPVFSRKNGKTIYFSDIEKINKKSPK